MASNSQDCGVQAIKREPEDISIKQEVKDVSIKQEVEDVSIKQEADNKPHISKFHVLFLSLTFSVL